MARPRFFQPSTKDSVMQSVTQAGCPPESGTVAQRHTGKEESPAPSPFPFSGLLARDRSHKPLLCHVAPIFTGPPTRVVANAFCSQILNTFQSARLVLSNQMPTKQVLAPYLLAHRHCVSKAILTILSFSFKGANLSIQLADPKGQSQSTNPGLRLNSSVSAIC